MRAGRPRTGVCVVIIHCTLMLPTSFHSVPIYYFILCICFFLFFDSPPFGTPRRITYANRSREPSAGARRNRDRPTHAKRQNTQKRERTKAQLTVVRSFEPRPNVPVKRNRIMDETRAVQYNSRLRRDARPPTPPPRYAVTMYLVL